MHQRRLIYSNVLESTLKILMKFYKAAYHTQNTDLI